MKAQCPKCGFTVETTNDENIPELHGFLTEKQKDFLLLGIDRLTAIDIDESHITQEELATRDAELSELSNLIQSLPVVD